MRTAGFALRGLLALWNDLQFRKRRLSGQMRTSQFDRWVWANLLLLKDLNQTLRARLETPGVTPHKTLRIPESPCRVNEMWDEAAPEAFYSGRCCIAQAAFPSSDRTRKRFIWIDRVFSIFFSSPRSDGPANVEATPFADARPVRPTRCTKSSACLGRS